MHQAARGFFEDERHLRSQFEYVTDSAPLNEKIEMNLKTQLGMVRNYFFILFELMFRAT